MADLVLIDCSRRAMRLTAAACGRFWLSCRDKKPEPWEGRYSCRSCATGARHAGHPEAALLATTEDLANLCPRCRRQRDRFVGRLCVSCYNRELEARKGANAKGGQPRICAVLRPLAVAVGVGERRVRTVAVPLAVDLAEVILLATKQMAEQAPPLMAFSRPRLLLADDGGQLELGL